MSCCVWPMVSPRLTNIIDKRLLTLWYAESPPGSWVSVSVLLARTLSSSVNYNPWATVHLSVCSPTPSAVCPRSHLWHRELPDTIHTAKPLVLPEQAHYHPHPHPHPLLGHSWSVTAHTPACQGYFLCPWEQNSQMLEGCQGLFGGTN